MPEMPKDMPEMPEEMMRDMERAMEEAFKMMPPFPDMCVMDHMCGNRTNVEGMDIEFDCGDGRGGKDSDSESDSDDEDGNYIEMSEDGIYARMNDGRGMGMEYSNDDKGIYFETEMGPMRTETTFEDESMRMEADMGDGSRIQVEASDDGIRMVMMNAKALAASVLTASAMSMSLF